MSNKFLNKQKWKLKSVSNISFLNHMYCVCCLTLNLCGGVCIIELYCYIYSMHGAKTKTYTSLSVSVSTSARHSLPTACNKIMQKRKDEITRSIISRLKNWYVKITM